MVRKIGGYILCDLCLQNPCHPRCPNYSPTDTYIRCDRCGETIQIGEEYIENEDGEIIHLDCAYGVRDLLDWLGENINVMEE